MILKPSLSFAGPREYRWQGLEVPVMMGKRRGAGSNRNAAAGSLRSQQSTQKPALFATRSLAVYSRQNMILKPSLSFAGPREYRWQDLEVPVMMGKRRGVVVQA